MDEITVRHKGEKNIYIHNDLSGAAAHAKGTIEAKLKTDDRKGIAFDYMSCLMMLAFTFEAQINFMGLKLLGDKWNERDPSPDKVKTVFAALKLNLDENNRPYSSISTLRKFRNDIAHGKPVEIKFDVVRSMPREEVDRAIDLNSDWVKLCNSDTVFSIYDDMDAVWKELLTASGLALYETLTHGSSGFKLESTIDA